MTGTDTTPARIVVGDQGRLTLAGEVTADSALALRADGEARIRAARSTGQTELVMDLAGLATASSIVLSLLLCWQRLARSEGLALTFIGTGERLRSLAGLSSLEAGLLDH
ncbi:MAG: STAS domain-containing protein [Marinobacter sp.]|uniref:STAS domain-containing protein n=1 Tax=Marinobacter sp. TaxID=50741 RepID=UPI00299F4157|nr:STAS domain-containing protein [Marinobacter sp.]MDX1633851.1 STAS domain-containing protein [Marinobacter sp.]